MRPRGTRCGGKPALGRMVVACAVAVTWLPGRPLHAAEELCGEPKAAPQALYERVSKDSRVREMHRNDLYVGLENGADGTLWTFTLPPHPAHPAAICRRVMERRGVIDIPTTIVCEGAEAACTRLKADFDALNNRVIDELYKRGKGPGTGK